jgi:hypothetical protein
LCLSSAFHDHPCCPITQGLKQREGNTDISNTLADRCDNGISHREFRLGGQIKGHPIRPFTLHNEPLEITSGVKLNRRRKNP